MNEIIHSAWLSYGIFFLMALVFSLLTNYLFLKFIKTLGMRNYDANMIRWSPDIKPSLGGITFFLVFLLSIASHSLISYDSNFFRNIQPMGIILSATLGFMMGLHDDSFNTRIGLKFITQLICGVTLILTGTYIQIFDNQVLNYLLTMLWVVGIMNSINMLDNMDGISATATLYITVTALLSILISNNIFNPYIPVLIGLIAALLGFLYYNWNPSKMIMGDTGSQFLGVILSVIGILYFWNSPNPAHGAFHYIRPVIIVAIVFCILIIDTTTVVIKRIGAGKSPFVGGRDHTTHHLVYLGFTDRQVALIFMAISILSSFIAIFIIFQPEWSVLLTISLVVYFMVLFCVLFYIANLNKNKKQKADNTK